MPWELTTQTESKSHEILLMIFNEFNYDFTHNGAIENQLETKLKHAKHSNNLGFIENVVKENKYTNYLCLS